MEVDEVTSPPGKAIITAIEESDNGESQGGAQGLLESEQESHGQMEESQGQIESQGQMEFQDQMESQGPLQTRIQINITHFPNELIQNIIVFLNNESKRALREVCLKFMNNIGRQTSWTFQSISAERLSLFADQVETVVGIEIGHLTGDPSQVEESIRRLVARHPELESVSIVESRCTDGGLQALLTGLPQLARLELTRCPLTGEGLEVRPYGQGSSTLTELNLARAKSLTDKGLERLARYIDVGVLRVLDLSMCRKVTETGFITFVNFVGLGLRQLSIVAMPMGCQKIEFLTPLIRLEELNFSNHSKVVDIGFIELLNKVGSNLRKLEVCEINIGFSQVDQLVELPHLEDLDITWCWNLNETRFVHFLNKVGGNLRRLRMTLNSLTLSEASALRPLPHMEDFDISSCWKVDELGLITLLNRLGANLIRLNIAGINVSLSEVGNLAPGVLGKLEELNMHMARAVTRTNLLALLAMAPIKRIDLRDSLITEEWLFERYPHIKCITSICRGV